MIHEVGGVTIVRGDALESLAAFPDQSVNCCVTSPPYFGLRDYGMAGQMGLESTPQEYVDSMVNLFRDVRRVLRDDGTLWLNLGDSYFSTTKGSGGSNPATSPKQAWKGAENGQAFTPIKLSAGASNCKPKDLIGIPWRVAFALQADGWYLRQDIIWAKPNPMPESVRDRCTKSHEYIFLLAKSEKYYFDAKAIQEPAAWERWGDQKNTKTLVGAANLAGNKTKAELQALGGGVKNKRDVWTITTKPYKDAHFATFPPDLIEPCILAGCPEGGVVLDPFGGSGTTGMVAQRHARRAVLLELNPAYVDLAVKRITGDALKAAA